MIAHLFLSAAVYATFRQCGAIDITVTDPSGEPVANQKIDITPTSDNGPLRQYGSFSFSRNVAIHGKTDKHGHIRFGHIALGKAYAVTVYYEDFQPITYFGAVFAGHPVHIVMRTDCVISGHVSSTVPRRSASRLEVDLKDTGYGHMMGYPGTVLETAKTDAHGNYGFTDLPPCEFNLTCAGAKNSPWVREARVGKRPWEIEEVCYTESTDYGSSGPTVLLNAGKETCDFRLSRPATISIKLINPLRVPLYGVFIGVDTYGGSDLGYGGPLFFPVVAGRHTITLSQDFPRAKDRTLAVVTAKEGESKTLTVTLPPGVHGRRTADLRSE